MGGGSSSPKYIDPVIIGNNNYNTNNQGLINSHERFDNLSELSDNYYEYRHIRFIAGLFGIVLGLILVLLFFKRKKR